MIPLLAIGTAISAASSVIKGLSWLSHQFSEAKGAQPSARRADAKAAPGRKPDFTAALSAKTAGQQMPSAPSNHAAQTGSAAAHASAAMIAAGAVPATDADIHARIQAGFTAYRRVGEHRDGRVAEPAAAA